MRISDWSSDVGSSDLLYRASVEAMAQRAQVTLVPGATESECLRASRRMPDPQDRDAFAHIVRVWQYAAYARRLPDEAEFDAMLGTLRSEEHTSELQSLMRHSNAVFWLKKKKHTK